MIARVQPLTTTRRIDGPFDYLVGDLEVEVGSVVKLRFGHQRLDGVVVGLAETSEVEPEKLVPLLSVSGSIPAELVDLAEWMGREYCSTWARALALLTPPPGRARTELWAFATGAGGKLTEGQAAALAALPARAGAALSTLRRLEKRGLVTIEPRVVRRAPMHAKVGSEHHHGVHLTEEQRTVLAALGDAVRGSHLLHGVTGSGKTEVYLQAARRVLDRGRGVIVLVPEIALTPQTVNRFVERFGDTVALLHSALSDGERFDEWTRLRRGEARVAVGPRSAVFAPMDDLGLIIIDEEHEPSYKHEGDPRYDARLVARWRAAYHGAGLLCGTATPRPETWRELPHLTLSRRVDGATLPPIEIVDMKGTHHPLHPVTQRALSEVAAAGEKAIVLLNRRGWSNFLTCRDCGKVWSCPNCDVALVLHRASGEIVCHHCGHRERVPGRCDNCGSLAVARHGAGTERLETELADTLGVPVFRLDADAGAAKDAVPRLLAAFAAAPAGLLVGTQLVAKGHDFPDVTLGVVVDADQTLRFPDFRAEERTFALVAQLAGRAGRGSAAGRVIVQTTTPEASSIAWAARHDAGGFLAEELVRREALGYPPYADLIRVVCSAPEFAPAAAAADRVAEAIGAATALGPGANGAAPATELLGPAPLFRLRNRERLQLVVRTTARAAAVAAVGAAVEAAARDRAFKDVAFSVDVDPV